MQQRIMVLEHAAEYNGLTFVMVSFMNEEGLIELPLASVAEVTT